MRARMRLDDLARAAAAAAAPEIAAEMLGQAEPDPVPDWWPEAFRRRQRRLRTRIAAHLADGEHSTYQLSQRLPQFEAAEIEHALCGLAADGVIAARRGAGPVRHGAPVRREWTYWRLA